MPPERIRHSDLLVAWGNNVTVSNPHLAREIQAARKQGGARLVVIDPKRTRIAEQADLYLQVRPGTDVVLALAMAAELERRGTHDTAFIDQWVKGHDRYMAHARAHTPEMVAEVRGVDSSSFCTLAQWYCEAKRSAFRSAMALSGAVAEAPGCAQQWRCRPSPGTTAGSAPAYSPSPATPSPSHLASSAAGFCARGDRRTTTPMRHQKSAPLSPRDPGR